MRFRMGSEQEAMETTLVALQGCTTRYSLQEVVNLLGKIFHCAMALHFTDGGFCVGYLIRREDFLPERRRGADIDNPWQEKMALVRPPMARFSDYVSERELIHSALYTDWLCPHHLKHGAMVASLAGRDPLAWLTLYRHERDGDFREEEMRALSRFQRHFQVAIERILTFEEYTDTNVRLQRFAHKYRLSKREVEILRLLLRGLSNAQIGNQLFISAGTVKVHLEHVFNKTGAGSRAKLIAMLSLREK
ncbi:MAG: helix-turn-helix transcriptional regulator [Fimbriimonadales bacterium]|nr:helix-turn-helix transcriptional regulator [Fimbriimonadales bacterium]